MVGFTEPSNAIVVAGNPLIEELKVETAANCQPGHLVKKGTNDDDIVVCGAGEMPVGVLGYEQARPDFKPATRSTDYAAGDWAPVLHRPGVVLLRLADGHTVNKGDPLVSAANGEVALASAMTVTIASGSSTVLSDKAQPDEAVAGGYGAEGPIVAFAAESVTTSGAADWIMAHIVR